MHMGNTVNKLIDLGRGERVSGGTVHTCLQYMLVAHVQNLLVIKQEVPKEARGMNHPHHFMTSSIPAPFKSSDR